MRLCVTATANHNCIKDGWFLMPIMFSANHPLTSGCEIGVFSDAAYCGLVYNNKSNPPSLELQNVLLFLVTCCKRDSRQSVDWFFMKQRHTAYHFDTFSLCPWVFPHGALPPCLQPNKSTSKIPQFLLMCTIKKTFLSDMSSLVLIYGLKKKSKLSKAYKYAIFMRVTSPWRRCHVC